MAWLNLNRRIDAVVSAHYGCPRGVIGRVAGARMARQHALETAWTVSLLALTPTDRVLEIGCGAGHALELAARQVPNGQVVGIDRSPVMVAMACRRNARAIETGSVVVEQADVIQLPFADHQFDKLWSIHSLYFWSDRPRALAELRRVVKPRGVLILTLTTGRLDALPSDPRPFQSLLHDHLLPAIQHAGFSSVSVVPGPDSRGWKIAAVVSETERRG